LPVLSALPGLLLAKSFSDGIPGRREATNPESFAAVEIPDSR
jgi:hypothetical protein